jgi:putative hemin transport protein
MDVRSVLSGRAAMSTAAAAETLYLQPAWEEIVKSLEKAGVFTVRTTSGGIAIEQTGAIEEVFLRGEGAFASVVQDDMDLRFLLKRLSRGQVHPAHTTIDLYNEAGALATSIHGADAEAKAAIESIARRFGTHRAEAQVGNGGGQRPGLSDKDVDAEAVRADWKAMTNVHHFEALLAKHRVGRLQAFRLMNGDFTAELAPSALPDLLEKLDRSGEQVMVFVANRGFVQIFSGPARSPKRVGHGWEIIHGRSKVFIPDSALQHLWLVNKPTAAGIISSLEILSESEDQALASIFGKHPHGDPQPASWLDLLNTLPRK